MLRRFLLVWSAYWALAFLLPVESVYANVGGAFLLQLSFVVLVTLSASIVLSSVGFKAMPAAEAVRIPGAEFIAWLSLAFSLVGFVLFLYDKVAIQGVDYSQGISIAREQWRQLGESRGGQASSIYSSLGYLLGSFYFVTTVLAVSQVHIGRNARIVMLGASFLCLMLNSIFTGGRSSILLMLAFVYCSFGVYRGLSLMKLFGRYQRVLIRVGVACLVFYAGLIFYLRAQVDGGDSLSTYVLAFLPWLGFEPRPWFARFATTNPMGDFASVFVLSVAYITHSFATTAAIVQQGAGDKLVVFVHLFNLLYKANLWTQVDSDWFLRGRFPSVPGALFLQFGYVGFVVCTLLIGAMAGVVKVWFSSNPHRFIPLGAYTAAEVTLILSPALLAADLLSFPFVVFAFGFCAIVQRGLRYLRGSGNYRAVRKGQMLNKSV